MPFNNSNLVKLIIDKTLEFGVETDGSIMTYLLSYNGGQGLNILQHAILHADHKIFSLVVNAISLLVFKREVSVVDCNKLIMEPNADGYNSLCWLLTLGDTEKLSVYLNFIKKSMTFNLLSTRDYRELFLFEHEVRYTRHALLSKLNAPTILYEKKFKFTTFSLALMAVDVKIADIYLDELNRALSLQLLQFAETADLLLVTNEDGYRLLDRLSMYGTTENFKLCLMIIYKAFANNLISKEIYFDLLLNHMRPGHSLLHQLILQNNLENLKFYMGRLQDLTQTGLLSELDYLSLFFKKNAHGYTVIHQAVNAYSVDVSYLVLQALKENLSGANYLRALSVNSGRNPPQPPKSIRKKHAAEINSFVKNEKLECAQPKDYFRLFPSMVLTPPCECSRPTIDLSSYDGAAL